MSQPIVSIRNVSKRFGSVVAVDDCSFDIRENEFFALLGPSGCGKTTLLRMIAGLETPSEGSIAIDGDDMGFTPPNRRPVNMVFQSYAVFPHMTVAQNVAYGLKVTGTPAAETETRVAEALEMVKLADYGKRKPDQLSGGQRQRVALARALVKRPKVLLLDEPLSALDAKLREQMQLELANLQESVGITFIIVTHDQDEALSMADRIAVMEKGRVCQVDGPGELYEEPKTRFVADFIGKVNLFDGDVKGTAGRGKVAVETAAFGSLKLPCKEPATGRVSVAVRPEKMRLTASKPKGSGLLKAAGKVQNVAYYGDVSYVYITTGDGAEISVNRQNDSRSSEDFERGQQVWVSCQPEDTLVLKE